jgi:hypothetical protein
MAADAPGTVAAKAVDITKAAVAVAAPIVQDAALKAADTAKAGIQIAKDATTKAAPVVQNGANDILDAARSGAGSVISAAKGAIETLTQNVEENCVSA